MSLRLISAPAVEPLSLAETKTYLRVDAVDEDAYISGLIVTARMWVEKRIARAFITQTWDYIMDAWPGSQPNGWWDGVREGPVTGSSRRAVELPLPPLQSVASVQTYDDADQITLFDASRYLVDTTRIPGRLVLRSNQVWPSVTRAANGIEIRFIAGYGDNASDVPGAFKQALYILVAHWFENRVQVNGQNLPQSAPLAVEALLTPFRKVSL